MSVLLCFTLLSFSALPCFSHVRLLYPEPRSDAVAPRNNGGNGCGGDTWDDGVALNRITEWEANSVVTIKIMEQIHHQAQPYRLALSGSNNDNFDECILLNHIPQHTRNGAKQLYIDITLPDYTCRNCTLQLINFQTGGRDDDNCCVYTTENTSYTCGSAQYWSCANVDITGGSNNDKNCYQPTEWSFRDMDCNYYSSEHSAEAWYDTPNRNDTLSLKTNENVDTPNNFCEGTTTSISRDSSCSDVYSESNLTFLQGGEIETGGVIAIILILVFGSAIAAAYFYSKKQQHAVQSQPSVEIDEFA